MTASSDNGGGQVLGLLCVERNGVGTNLAVHFFPVEFFLSYGKLHLRRNTAWNRSLITQ